jgi:hypothetical protein
MADPLIWPALQVLYSARHTWTLQALQATGTRIEFTQLPVQAAGAYLVNRSLIVINSRYAKSDPRALATAIEHEGKHVADWLSGLDIVSPEGCIATEVNAFREQAKTWGELVGPNGKANPQDDLEVSLNIQLAVYQQKPQAIPSIIADYPGYQAQCRVVR